MGNNNMEVTYGERVIAFEVVYSQRKTLGITVTADQAVYVRAPYETNEAAIKNKVESRASWICKQQRMFAAIAKNSVLREEEYVAGETFHYLGRKYRLKIVKADLNSIKLQGRYLIAYVKDKHDAAVIERLVDGWYKEHARVKLQERMAKYSYILNREKITLNTVYIRKLAKRWGSCTNKNNIILNTALVKASIQCIDYVVIHEICHLKYLNHSSKFHKLLQKYLPDWQHRKRLLDMQQF